MGRIQEDQHSSHKKPVTKDVLNNGHEKLKPQTSCPKRPPCRHWPSAVCTTSVLRTSGVSYDDRFTDEKTEPGEVCLLTTAVALASVSTAAASVTTQPYLQHTGHSEQNRLHIAHGEMQRGRLCMVMCKWIEGCRKVKRLRKKSSSSPGFLGKEIQRPSASKSQLGPGSRTLPFLSG